MRNEKNVVMDFSPVSFYKIINILFPFICKGSWGDFSLCDGTCETKDGIYW